MSTELCLLTDTIVYPMTQVECTQGATVFSITFVTAACLQQQQTGRRRRKGLFYMGLEAQAKLKLA